jgi:hypothetical protein
MVRERKQVLEMLAEGKISPEEAERLLDKLGRSGESSEDPSRHSDKRPPKYLCVKVGASEGEVVSIRLPMALVRTGMKLTSMLPRHVNDALAKQGIDLSKLSGLSGEELVEALEELRVDVDSEGESVRICCE